jgi:hypothetical protein
MHAPRPAREQGLTLNVKSCVSPIATPRYWDSAVLQLFSNFGLSVTGCRSETFTDLLCDLEAGDYEYALDL